MTYNPEIPIGTLSPAAQVNDVRTNFSSYDTVFSNNHTSMNNTAQGNHEAVIIQKQTGDPDVIEDINTWYAKDYNSLVSKEPQLFVRIPKFLPTKLDPSTPGNPPMQITYNKVNIAGPQYQSFLAGGFLIYFGSVSAVNVTITLSPTPKNILIAEATSNTMTSIGTPIPFDYNVQILSPSTFRINSQSATGSYSFTWLAIGVA